MKKLFLLAFLLLTATVAHASSPTDIVPRGSGLYDALSVLAQDKLLPAGAPDAADLLGVTGRLYTRGQMAAAVRGVTIIPHGKGAPLSAPYTGRANSLQQQPMRMEPSAEDRRDAAALAFARNALAPELGLSRGSGGKGASVSPSGFAEAEERGQDDNGTNLKSRGELLGRARVLGTLGRDGAYTVSATNLYRQSRDHSSFTTKGGADNPDALNGIDEAYATALGRHGVRITGGYIRQEWGAGWRGSMLVGDNGPSHPTLQVELPFSLGSKLGRYTFTQYEATYKNGGRTVYQGGRRLEHPVGDRTNVTLEEGYTSNEFHKPLVLLVPYYTFQAHVYPNNREAQFFNYFADAALSVRPQGPNGNDRAYTELVIDDIQTPSSISLGNHVPRKIGYLLGYARSFPQTGTDAVIEYARTDRATYTDQYPELAWLDNTLPQAHPIGTNGRELYGRVGQRFGSHIDAALEGRDRRRVTSDFPAPNARSVDFTLNYRLTAARSVGLRLSDYREDPFTGINNSLVPVSGGAAGGEHLRRRLIGVSFLQAF